jgi:hypothetical protein
MALLTSEQVSKMIKDIRNANPNIVTAFATLPRDKYTSSNELYEELGRMFEVAMADLRENRIISANRGGYGQTFSTYGFPYEIPNMEQLDCIMCFIELHGPQFRYRSIFRYITNDEVEYSTTIRIAYIPGNDRLEKN